MENQTVKFIVMDDDGLKEIETPIQEYDGKFLFKPDTYTGPLYVIPRCEWLGQNCIKLCEKCNNGRDDGIQV